MARALQLSRGLDSARLRPAFERFGRLHLPGILPVRDAQAIHAALIAAPYHRSLTASGKSYDIALDTLAAMPPERRAELEAAILEGGKTGFQYQFDAWRLSDLMEAGQRTGGALAPLEAVYDLINSEGFLAFIRTLTGDPRCAYADAQATRYRPGDFLTAHDDDVAGKKRLYAMVLNFTPAWRPDWGGLLAFHDADGHVSEAYTPTFNALNIFRVPQQHAVTQVASFAGAERLSITGWIRER
ncbi:MAG: 2OG-Fe(II) oxygenase family protein [Phenylobacterium sp.]|uniref:2OG-Fe(II) oxygenase n=1 Tax=Phenylobacterium sp. TaxID=1871053 RepID=UPI00271DED15|nr:2OG-Fe(II) oxygenase family protein [Phenylobacterium sp.]MDO8910943.1 2OG-Fe(II) oxygenase family protein [Phenylobacterium sp.]MDP3098970.1 2OG-Fe(II) oxygenase family protein [Phenylobacterium sp.]